MTHTERAKMAKEIIGSKKMMELRFSEINNAYYAIYNEYLKRSCLNAIRNAYQQITNFIKEFDK